MKRAFPLLILPLVAALVVSGCEVLDPAPDLEVAVTGPATISSLNQTVTYTATVTPSDNGTTPEWSVQGSALEPTSTPGQFRSTANGTATVTATVGGFSGSMQVEVSQAPAGIVFGESEYTIATRGAQVMIDATVVDAVGTAVAGAGIEWESTDEDVLVVASNGTARAEDYGEAWAVARSGSLSDSVRVHIPTHPDAPTQTSLVAGATQMIGDTETRAVIVTFVVAAPNQNLHEARAVLLDAGGATVHSQNIALPSGSESIQWTQVWSYMPDAASFAIRYVDQDGNESRLYRADLADNPVSESPRIHLMQPSRGGDTLSVQLEIEGVLNEDARLWIVGWQPGDGAWPLFRGYFWGSPADSWQGTVSIVADAVLQISVVGAVVRDPDGRLSYFLTESIPGAGAAGAAGRGVVSVGGPVPDELPLR